MNHHLSPRSGQPPLPHNHARYDHAGNMTGDAAHSYFYDAESRIYQVDGTQGNCSTATVCYDYDGDGLRVEKSSGTLYWRSIWGDALAESDSQGNITNEYVFFAGRRIARISSSTVNYFYSDGLGTIHTITDSTGHPCYDASFTPYGQEMLNPNITQTCSSNYKFTGYEYDSETGLYYAFARYYNSRLDRFMSADVYSGILLSPQTGNLYSYSVNAPTMFTDPSGFQPCPLVIAGTGDNPKNSQAILAFADQIGANVVFPSPSPAAGAIEDSQAWYTSSGIQATVKGIEASSGGTGGPTSVFTFSVGAGYYDVAASRTPNTTPNNTAYVFPFRPGPNSMVHGKDGTFVYSGTGFVNGFLNGTQANASDSNLTPIALPCKHDQSCAFPTMESAPTAYIPFNPGPKCDHRQTIVAGHSGGGSGQTVEFFTLWTLCDWWVEGGKWTLLGCISFQ